MSEHTDSQPRLDISELLDAVGEDPEMLQEILSVFLETSQVMVAAVGQAVIADDRAAVATGAHGMVGAAGSVGGLRLAAWARELEQAALGKTEGDLGVLLAAMTAELQEVAVELHQRLSNLGRDAAQPGSQS